MIDPYLFTPAMPLVNNGTCQSAQTPTVKALVNNENLPITTVTYTFTNDVSFVFNNETYDFRAGYPYALSGLLLAAINAAGVAINAA